MRSSFQSRFTALHLCQVLTIQAGQTVVLACRVLTVLGQGAQLGQWCPPPRDMWPCLQTLLAVITGRDLLFTSSVQKPGTLLNALWHTGQPSQREKQRLVQPKMSVVLTPGDPVGERDTQADMHDVVWSIMRTPCSWGSHSSLGAPRTLPWEPVGIDLVKWKAS